MDSTADDVRARGHPLDDIAVATVDGEGTVVGWSAGAAALLGRTAGDVCGRPLEELVAEVTSPDGGGCGERPSEGRARLRHRSGATVDVVFRWSVLDGAGTHLVLAAPLSAATDWEQGLALLHLLIAQDRMGVAILDTDLRVIRTNITPEMLDGNRVSAGDRFSGILSPEDAESIEIPLRRVLESGVPLIRSRIEVRRVTSVSGRWVMSLSGFRMQDRRGDPTGVAVTVTDHSAQHQIRRNLALLHDSAVRIGSSLDVVRTAQELADVLVPGLGDLATVDLSESVLAGDEPPRIRGGGTQRLTRTATAPGAGEWPAALLGAGEKYPALPDSRALRRLQEGHAVTMDRATVSQALGGSPLDSTFIPDGAHSVVTAPLLGRGFVLGTVSVWRIGQPDPFDETERVLLTEIASRAALGVDNARRYTREHHAAAALQNRLLPRAETDVPAVEAAGIYLPAGGQAGISGDWFDVIALPSLRVALVIGDVIGHGLAATATMGRLRTAIQTFADLELDPTEVLTHVEDLVQRLAAEAPSGQQDSVGATCLYAVYDPVTGRCTLASAGQPQPVVVGPDGAATFVEITPGPPLGVGGVPYESVSVDLPPGSVLGLYTDGVFGLEGFFDAERGMERLRNGLGVHTRPDRSMADIGRDLVADVADRPPHDDVALLLARTRLIAPDHIASWEFPAAPASVGEAREAAMEQLSAWGLDDLSLTTELVVSELVTNAIRYAGGPVGLRLLRENVLICEVADPSNTQPRLVRAGAADEGGRGLLIVARCTSRWGSRYGRHGKTIWTEQPLDGLPEVSVPLFDVA